MITLRPSKRSEIDRFDQLDRQEHARGFVIQTGKRLHLKQFIDPRISYLTIENFSGEFCGYFILVLDENSRSVEFRRILIDHNRRGIGQIAIREMEKYCKSELNVKRIWLDVFQDNEIGVHIYEKMEYERFNKKSFEGKTLYLYEKAL